jgi:hypothetical protein
MLYKTNLTGWYNSTPFSPAKTSKAGINLLFISIGVLGCYMFYRKDVILKLTPVYSNLEIKKKSEIIRSVAETFQWTNCESDGLNYFRFSLLRLFSMSVDLDIVILTNEKGFYINVTDMGKNWIFSWGSYQLWTDKIKNAIQTQLLKGQ